MKKLVATSSIIAFTLLISVAIYYYFFISTKATATKTPFANSNKTDMFQEVTATQAAKNVKETNELKVTLATPKEQFLLTQNPSIKIAGATKRNAVVAVTGGKKTLLRSVNADGSFAPDVELNEGVNHLIIHVYDQNGAKEEITRSIMYLKDAVTPEHTIVTGMFNVADNKPQFVLNEEAKELSPSKQTKMYQTNNGTKKSIRSITALSKEYPLYVVHEKDSPENLLVLLQQTDEQTKPILVFGKAIDKSVVDESFNIGLLPLDKTDAREIIVDSSTTIFRAEDTKQTLRGTDIKIGDKIIALLTDTEQNKATQVLIIPGQAAGILRDVKQD